MSFIAATPAASGSEDARRRRSVTTFIVVMGFVAPSRVSARGVAARASARLEVAAEHA